MWPWFLQRLTGALLAIWLAAHMAVLHGGGHENQFFFAVTRRLRSGGWIVFDLLLIVLCLYHALGGVRAVLFDVIPGDRGRRRIELALWVVGLLTLVFAYKVLTGFMTEGEVIG
jgi:succinate dehydrogenase hydrophobic anchor subunit